jgi:hypothetical protein
LLTARERFRNYSRHDNQIRASTMNSDAAQSPTFRRELASASIPMRTETIMTSMNPRLLARIGGIFYLVIFALGLLCYMHVRGAGRFQRGGTGQQPASAGVATCAGVLADAR